MLLSETNVLFQGELGLAVLFKASAQEPYPWLRGQSRNH